MIKSISNSEKWENSLEKLIKINEIVPNAQLYSRIKNLKGCPSKNTIIDILENLCIDKKIVKIKNKNYTVYYAINENEYERFQSMKKTGLKNLDEIIKYLEKLSDKSGNVIINVHQLLRVFQILIGIKNKYLEELSKIENIQGVSAVIILRDISSLKNNFLTRIDNKDKTWCKKYVNVKSVERKLFKSEHNIAGKPKLEQEREKKAIRKELERELKEFYKIDDTYFKLNKQK